MESTTTTTPMTELDQTKIAETEAKLKVSEDEGDNVRRNDMTTLLIKQQEKENLLLATQSKCIFII